MSGDARESPAGDSAAPRLPDARHLLFALAVFCLGLLIGFAWPHSHGGKFLVGVAGFVLLAAVLAMMRRIAGRAGAPMTASGASYRAFFEQAVEGIFRTTPDGHYLVVNQALARIYGYETPEALTAGLTDIAVQLYVDSGRRDEFRALMQAHDLVTDFVSEIFHRSGKRIWISENARAVRDPSGALICYEGTVQDVTEKFEAEQALRAALRQAELANRAKAAFLAAMSHELKTPLNAVLGFAEIIRDQVLGEVGQPAYREYAADIHASGKRLLAVINDVLDVSRLEGGLLALETRACDALELAEQASALAASVTGDDRPVFIDIAGLPALDVDPRRMAQALANLIANALKFTPEGGKIALTGRAAPEGGVKLVVFDTGIGMAPETVAGALEPFRQLDGSLSRKFEGAGLGLPLARALVDLHGGTLAIRSGVGQGTTVTITLPASRLIPRIAKAS